MTPKEFYHTQKWIKLIALLKQERTKDGQLICEHCGLPIVRSYDCIGHHKIELTEDNVEDFNISLNPDNIELIHFKCHNLIHERFEGNKQKVFLVYGSPCSGKTTFVNDNAYDDDLILDVDRIWSALSNGGLHNKDRGKAERAGRLKQNVFGVRDCILEMIQHRQGKWRNAYIIGGYPLRTDRDRLCELLDAEPVFIEASIDECLLRAKAERPDEWQDYIRDWFEVFTP